MSGEDDDIDEVALNVLLAEGVDLSTALEASRRDSGAESSQAGCLGSAAMILTAAGAALLYL